MKAPAIFEHVPRFPEVSRFPFDRLAVLIFVDVSFPLVVIECLEETIVTVICFDNFYPRCYVSSDFSIIFLRDKIAVCDLFAV